MNIYIRAQMDYVQLYTTHVGSVKSRSMKYKSSNQNMRKCSFLKSDELMQNEDKVRQNLDLFFEHQIFLYKDTVTW